MIGAHSISSSPSFLGILHLVPAKPTTQEVRISCRCGTKHFKKLLIYLIEGVNSLHLFIWQVTAVCFTFWRCVWSGVRSRQPDGESTRLGIGQVCPTIRAGRSRGIWGMHQGPHLSPPMCLCVCVRLCKGQTDVWPVFSVVAFVGFKNLNFCSPAARTRRFRSNCSSCCTRKPLLSFTMG